MMATGHTKTLFVCWRGGTRRHIPPAHRTLLPPSSSKEKMKVVASALCQCGQADQTPTHILQDCPLFEEERLETWPEGAGIQPKLWGTASDLRRTAGFMRSLEQRL